MDTARPAPRRGQLVNVLIGASLVLAVVAVAQIAAGDWGVRGREAQLRASLVDLRQAVNRYQEDHGFYPASDRDYNRAGDPAVFRAQLTGYTDSRGEPSPTRDAGHRFGPYLKRLPAEPITGSRDITIDTRSARLLPELAESVAGGDGDGGWFYEARTGHVVADLGRPFKGVYARF